MVAMAVQAPFQVFALATAGVVFGRQGSAIAAFVGAGFETSAAALKVTHWGATPLAKPIRARFMRLSTRADVIGFTGKVIGAAGGIMGGILSIYDGSKEMSISPRYGRAMIGLGVASIFSAVLILFSATVVVGFILAIIIAIITVIVGLFKPDAINKWLAQTMYFGNTSDSRFPNFEAQSKAFSALSNPQR